MFYSLGIIDFLLFAGGRSEIYRYSRSAVTATPVQSVVFSPTPLRISLSAHVCAIPVNISFQLLLVKDGCYPAGLYNLPVITDFELNTKPY